MIHYSLQYSNITTHTLNIVRNLVFHHTGKNASSITTGKLGVKKKSIDESKHFFLK